MAEENKQEKKKNKETKKKSSVKRPTLKKSENVDKKPSETVQTPAAHEKSGEDIIAVKQRRSLIMFITSVVLASIIFIPGDMIWLWAHNAVRGTFSVLALFWPLLLLFLAVATMLDKEIPKLKFRTSFAAGLAVALNACIYIFMYDGEFNIKQAFSDGITYSGGGALGFIFGAPFIKLFGIVPAKILIILVIMALAVFALGIPVKHIYNKAFDKITDKIAQLIVFVRRKITERHPVKITDDKYFDSDGYDAFDISEESDDDLFDDDEYDGYEPDEDTEGYEEDGADETDDSPVLSGELFEDEEDYFPEEDESGPSDDDDYSIDIDIDEPAEPILRKNSHADEDESMFADIFGDDFLDTVEEGYRPEAGKAAKQITQRKKNISETESDGERKPQGNVKKRSNRSYIFPPPDLLAEGKTDKTNYKRELEENAKKLISTLESFSVGAKIDNITRGPSITRYEIKPAPGVKISKITGLSDDIALSLAADGGVRMEAPIPGKSAIGVEIPNKTVTPVTMRELLESPEFSKNKDKKKLDCVIGKDVAGKIIMMDLASMPHLLIAGTTGSGKSVCVNSILMSILFRATPDEVKLILIDPKLVEFTKYKGIPHLLVPVVSDVKKAAGALGWAVTEMEDRYKQLSLYNVKDIDSYNKMVERNLASMTQEEIDNPGNGEVVDGEFVPPKATKKLAKIVIAIDELADLMMAAPGEVEDYICRLAQKARAAGMHLVIATQRPSVNVITGVIKANIPSRISLKVASYVDSKTILDTSGGEKLIGRGDMLYSPVGISKPIRVQGGFSSDEDIEAVTDFIKKHASSDYNEDISEMIDKISEEVGVKGSKSGSGEDLDEMVDSDPLLEDAIKIVVELGQASASLLQRKLKVGYARAGRLVDIMEQMGIVGKHMGSKSREVLITEQEWIERKISGNSEE